MHHRIAALLPSLFTLHFLVKDTLAWPHGNATETLAPISEANYKKIQLGKNAIQEYINTINEERL